jgi:hypothetical protein
LTPPSRSSHPNATKPGGVALPYAKFCHAADFFCNGVQMVWPSFAEHHTIEFAGSDLQAPHVRALVDKAFIFTTSGLTFKQRSLTLKK